VTRFMGADYRTLLPEYSFLSREHFIASINPLRCFFSILIFHLDLPSRETLHLRLSEIGEIIARQRGVHSIAGEREAL
jgi:hypothetical protein